MGTALDSESQRIYQLLTVSVAMWHSGLPRSAYRLAQTADSIAIKSGSNEQIKTFALSTSIAASIQSKSNGYTFAVHRLQRAVEQLRTDPHLIDDPSNVSALAWAAVFGANAHAAQSRGSTQQNAVDEQLLLQLIRICEQRIEARVSVLNPETGLIAVQLLLYCLVVAADEVPFARDAFRAEAIRAIKRANQELEEVHDEVLATAVSKALGSVKHAKFAHLDQGSGEIKEPPRREPPHPIDSVWAVNF